MSTLSKKIYRFRSLVLEFLSFLSHGSLYEVKNTLASFPLFYLLSVAYISFITFILFSPSLCIYLSVYLPVYLNSFPRFQHHFFLTIFSLHISGLHPYVQWPAQTLDNAGTHCKAHQYSQESTNTLVNTMISEENTVLL